MSSARFQTVGFRIRAARLCRILLLALAIPAPLPAAPVRTGPAGLVADAAGHTLYVALANQVVAWDLANHTVRRAIDTGVAVQGLALAPDGSRLYATTPVPEGRVLIIETQDLHLLAAIRVGHTPVDVAVTPDGKQLFVCNRFTDDLSVVNLDSGRETTRIRVSREPVALALTPDGQTLVVANHLPVGPGNGDFAAAELTLIDAPSLVPLATIPLYNGSVALQDVALSPDGRMAYVPHLLARYQLPTTQLDQGWINSNALSVFDILERKLVNTVLLDDVDQGAANPWAAAVTRDGDNLCVTTAGTHELQVIDRIQLHQRLELAARGVRVTEVTASANEVRNDPTFLLGIKRRLPLAGKGPRALALIGSSAYAAEYFSDSLGWVNLASDVRPIARSLALGSSAPMDAVRLGELLFNDATLCFQQWQSCASCHPGQGRVDALNWDLLNDGLANPKNTKSLLWAPRTPPAMSLGVRANSQAGVRAGIRHILMTVQPESSAQAIDAYLESLAPVPSPHRIKGELSPEARRGQRLFNQAGCLNCHPLGLYTDLHAHPVGTGLDVDADEPFDTPTLVELWRTAPYLHDGRAETVVDIFRHHNPNDQHGQTSRLSEADLEDLASYLLSL